MRLDASRVGWTSEPSFFVSDSDRSELDNRTLRVVCRPRDVCSPASVRADCGVIRFRREAGRILCPQRRAFSTNGRVANPDGSGRSEN